MKLLQPQSLEVSDKFYSCNWQGKSDDEFTLKLAQMFGEQIPLHDFPTGIQFMKCLKFSISRSQIPLVLMAMKFSALALPTFTRVKLLILFPNFIKCILKII